MLGIEILGIDPRQQDGALAGVDLDPALGGANLQVVEVEPGDLEPDPVLVRVEIGDVVVAVIGAEDETVAPLATDQPVIPGAALQPVGARVAVQPVAPAAPGQHIATWQAEARARAVKAETTRRIDAVASPYARENMIGAAAAGALSAEQQAAYVASVQWIADMRAACQALIADAEADYTADANWPTCPPGAAALAAAF